MFIPARRVLTVLLACALVGCGGGDGSGGAGGTDQPPDGESSLAHRWTVSLGTPQGAATCFRPGQSLPLDIAIYNREGEVLSSRSIQISGDSASAFEDDGEGGWVIRGEGDYLFDVVYTGETTEDATIAPVRLELRSDQTPPEITVLSPSRAAMVTSSTDVRVEAEVTDTISSLASVTVNEEEQLGPSDRQALDIDVAPRGQWGLNTVSIVASDSCGNTERHAQSYLRSEQYLEAATESNPASRVPNG